jgi:ABC-type transport system involved in multi-copper enzyme maturation permease subunit
MFPIIKTIAISEFQALSRQKTFALVLVIFLAMALFSTYIGWSTKNTILKVYAETVKEMVAGGVTNIPANPFLNTPPLAILKNMVVYVFLIGSLLAIIVGYSAFIRERRAGVARILFSKPISRQAFIFGKMVGILLVLTVVMTASFGISVFSASLVSGRLLSVSEILRVFIFYGISLGYVLIFAMLGLLFAITSKSESLALLIPVTIWLLISFVMPQLTSALDPTALLNPTNFQATFPQSHFFRTAQAMIEPFSISESYKIIGRTLLEGGPNIVPVWWSSVLLLVVLVSDCFYAVKRFNVCEEEMNE